jgi:hypothetical protein
VPLVVVRGPGPSTCSAPSGAADSWAMTCNGPHGKTNSSTRRLAVLARIIAEHPTLRLLSSLASVRRSASPGGWTLWSRAWGRRRRSLGLQVA